MKTTLCCAVCIMGALFINSMVYATALDDYILPQDPNFLWREVNRKIEYYLIIIPVTISYTLDMNSQTWRGLNEVDTTLWNHSVTVTTPYNTSNLKNTALILINGGNIGEDAPSINPSDPNNKQFRDLALATGSAIIELRGVPNQPLQFADEDFTRSEDEIIAYSWDKFLNGGDPNWPVQLPMVKAVVACMDAVQEFEPAIEHFILAGGSKRGWTAWLTAAVDDRVVAVAPIVSDLLNMRRSFAHHWSCYGFWAEALSPYEDMNIFNWFDTPQADALLAIVDPYEYRDRLDIPKFIVTAAGDDFFVHDSIQFYLDDLLGETYVRTVPNTNHYLDGAYDEVIANMVPYYDAFLNDHPRPQFSWTRNADGSMTVDPNEITGVPTEVILWQADNSTDRDFRRITIGDAWTSMELFEQSPGVFLADPGVPITGWRSYFVELVYPYTENSLLPEGYDQYHFTTEMRVVPEVRPFEADWSRDRATDMLDVVILAENWLSATPYYDIMPRRTGDGIINLGEMSVFSLHWLHSN